MTKGAIQKTTAGDFHGFMVQQADRLRQWVRPGLEFDEMALIRYAQLSFSRDEKLQDRRVWPSIYTSLIMAAQLGLEPSGPLGEAHLVPFFDKKLGHYVVSLMPGYRGLIKLMTQSGQITRVRAHVVHSNDAFAIKLGSDSQVMHEIALGDRGTESGAYAIAWFSDGSHEPEWMSWDEIQKIREMAGRGSPAWSQWPGQMARKTVIKRLANQMPMSAVARQAIELDNAVASGEYQGVVDVAQSGDVVDIQDAPKRDALKAKLKTRKLAADVEDNVPEFDVTDVDG